MKKLNEREEQYKRAITLWGERAQYEMAQEEADELALAVRKYYRKNYDEKSYVNLVSEIADVEIMIEQIKMMNRENGIEQAITQEKIYKVQRLKERIDKKAFDLEVTYEEVKQ